MGRIIVEVDYIASGSARTCEVPCGSPYLHHVVLSARGVWEREMDGAGRMPDEILIRGPEPQSAVRVTGEHLRDLWGELEPAPNNSIEVGP